MAVDSSDAVEKQIKVMFDPDNQSFRESLTQQPLRCYVGGYCPVHEITVQRKPQEFAAQQDGIAARRSAFSIFEPKDSRWATIEET